jgi:hypothetical protein
VLLRCTALRVDALKLNRCPSLIALPCGPGDTVALSVFPCFTAPRSIIRRRRVKLSSAVPRRARATAPVKHTHPQHRPGSVVHQGHLPLPVRYSYQLLPLFHVSLPNSRGDLGVFCVRFYVLNRFWIQEGGFKIETAVKLTTYSAAVCVQPPQITMHPEVAPSSLNY